MTMPRSRRTPSTSLAWVCLAWAITTCGLGCNLQTFTVRQTAAVFAEGKVAIDRESDPQLAREALPANIKTLESLLVSAPDNERLLRLLTESYYSYAFGFLEMDLMRAKVEGGDQEEIEQLTERTVDFYIRARDYGFRLLDRPAFREAATKPNLEKVQSILDETTPEDVPGLFWTAFGWGGAINLAQQDPDMAAALPVVEAIMKRVVELNARYYNSGPHIFLGVSFASKPKLAGGDPQTAKSHFEAAMKQHGDRNLMIPFLYGRYYAVQTQNRELFDSMMQKVLQADLSQYPKLRLNNELARRRAAFWQEHADELFY